MLISLFPFELPFEGIALTALIAAFLVTVSSVLLTYSITVALVAAFNFCLGSIPSFSKLKDVDSDSFDNDGSRERSSGNDDLIGGCIRTNSVAGVLFPVVPFEAVNLPMPLGRSLDLLASSRRLVPLCAHAISLAL